MAAAGATNVIFSHRLLQNPPPLPWRKRSAHHLSVFPSPPFPSLRLSRPLLSSRSETLENQDPPDDADDSASPSSAPEEASPSAVAEELKVMMAERKKKEEESPDLVAGVAAEVREIEWPAFSKVVGTTGIVLAVIAGSSVALLTVNAVLAEISDRVFAGRGLQDFFL